MDNSSKKTEKTDITPYQKQMMIFFFKCIASELSKTIIFLIVFSLWGLTKEFWAALFFMMLYRTSSGGLHCKSYFSCLALSFLILFLAITMGVHLPISLWFLLPSTLIMAIFAYHFSPVQAPTRPPLAHHLVKRAKKRTFISIMIFLVLAIFFPKSVYIGIGFWLLVLHDVQLYIANIIRRCRKDV